MYNIKVKYHKYNDNTIVEIIDISNDIIHKLQQGITSFIDIQTIFDEKGLDIPTYISFIQGDTFYYTGGNYALMCFPEIVKDIKFISPHKLSHDDTIKLFNGIFKYIIDSEIDVRFDALIWDD